MKEEVPNIYTIDMLAEESGLNRRTVRYYIHRGLLLYLAMRQEAGFLLY